MMKSRKRKKREMKEMRHRIANNRAMNAVKIGCNIGLSGTESLVSAADPVVITEKPSLAKIKTVSRKRNADKVEDDKNLALFQKLTISSTNWEKLIEPSIECSSNGFISWSVFVRSYMQVSRVFINNVRNSFSLNFYEKLDTFASMDQISEDLKGCMLKTREEMITELEKNNLISLFNSNALAQLIVSELAALKSLIMNNFIRILTCDIARQLSSEFVEVNSNYADRVAAALVYFILGSGTKVDVSSGNSNEDEDSVQSTPVSLDCVVLPLDTFFGRWKPGTAAHKSMISYFREGSFTRKTLIRRYVPVVLRALISDTRSGWLENIKTNDYVLVLKYMKSANIAQGKVLQLLWPQPSTSCTSILMTNSILASLFCSFFNLNIGINAEFISAFEYLEQLEMPVSLLKANKRKKKGKKGLVPVQFNSFIDRVKFDMFEWARNGDVLWKATFPGVSEKLLSRTTNKKLNFQHSATINEDAINILCTDSRRHTAGKKALGYGSCNIGFGHSYRDYRKLKKGDDNCILNISKVARIATSPDIFERGLKSYQHITDNERSFTGKINLDYSIADFATGDKYGKELVDNHVIIALDFGIINEISAVFLDFTFNDNQKLEGKFIKQLFTAEAKYQNSGHATFTEEYLKSKEIIEKHAAAISVNSGRTYDSEKHEAFVKTFNEHGYKILAENSKPQMSQLRNNLKKNKQRQMFELVNILVAHAEAIRGSKKGVTIIVVGNPTFSPNVKGKRSVAPKSLLRWLSKFFTVLVVDEYNTSKNCPMCFQPLEKHGNEGTRMWKCKDCKTSTGHDLIVNKDVSAAINMANIAVHYFLTGERHPSFSRQV